MKKISHLLVLFVFLLICCQGQNQIASNTTNLLNKVDNVIKETAKLDPITSKVKFKVKQAVIKKSGDITYLPKNKIYITKKELEVDKPTTTIGSLLYMADKIKNQTPEVIVTDLSGEAEGSIESGLYYFSSYYNTGVGYIFWLDTPINIQSNIKTIELSNDNGFVYND